MRYLDVQDPSVPGEVVEEVENIWQQNGYGNNVAYERYEVDRDYWVPAPKLDAYLKSFGITEIHLHYWW